MLFTRFKPAHQIRHFSAGGTLSRARKDGNKTKLKQRASFDNVVEEKLGAEALDRINSKASKYNTKKMISGMTTIDSLDRTEFKDKLIYKSCQNKLKQSLQIYQQRADHPLLFSNAGYLDYHKQRLIPIENTWQDPAIIDTLGNDLEKLLPFEGIFPVEEVNKIHKGKLGDFFTRLPQYSEIDESCIPPYHPPSTDPNLLKIADENNMKYIMSTSTVTSMMSHAYFALSNYKSPHFFDLSESYDREPLKYMVSQRKPANIWLRKLPGDKMRYAVDSDKGFGE